MDKQVIEFRVTGQKKPVKLQVMGWAELQRNLLVYRMLNSLVELGPVNLQHIMQQALEASGFSIDLYRVVVVTIEPDEYGSPEAAAVFTVKADSDDVIHRVAVTRSFPCGWHLSVDDHQVVPGAPLWSMVSAFSEALTMVVVDEVDLPRALAADAGPAAAVAVLGTDDDGVPVTPPASAPPTESLLSPEQVAEQEAADTAARLANK